MDQERLYSGKIEFSGDGRNGVLGFVDVPKKILDKVLIILMDHTVAKIDDNNELRTSIYPKKRRANNKKDYLIAGKCSYK